MTTDATTIGARLLVALDGSPLAEQALPYAAALGGPDAELLLLHVIPQPELSQRLLRRGPAGAADIIAAAEARAKEALNAAAGRLPPVGRARETIVAVGDPAEQILAVAAERGATMIVAATRGRGALGRLAFGSVADRVARAAPIPVLLVPSDDAATKPAGNGPIRRLIVPLDGSEPAAVAVPIAIEIARRLGAPVRLLRAISQTAAVPALTGIGAAGLPETHYAQVLATQETQARRHLEGFAGTFASAGVEVMIAVETGPPAATIIDAAMPGDLIVMTSHGRGGVRRWLLGSVADKLIRAGRAPVLLVRWPHDAGSA